MKNFKLILSIFILSCACLTFGFQEVSIFPTGYPETYDLAGDDGENGMPGQGAFALDCSDGIFRHGRDGDPGFNGGPGQKGKDAFIYYQNLSQLENITLFQEGGFGGIPGPGGAGTAGCNGGVAGVQGPDGNPGPQGEYGDIFLFHESEPFFKGDSTKVISLIDFSLAPISLTKIRWSFHEGARKLFSSNSRIKNYYKKFNGQIRYKVKLKWSVGKDIQKYGDTRLAFSVKGEGLEVTSYSGPIIDYKISKVGTNYTFEIVDAKTDDEFKNLHFGKMRGVGEDIIFEVKEKFTPSVAVETKFVMSLYAVKDQTTDKFIAQFKLSDKFVEKKGKVFIIKLGKMNFPSRFKTKGAKLRVHLSIYRKAREQTRAFALKGVFKI